MLTMNTVSKFLSDRHMIYVHSMETVESAMNIMDKEGTDSIGVQSYGRFAGIFTRSDLVSRVLQKGLRPERTLVQNVMTPDPQTISPETPISEAYRMMRDLKVSHLPVVDDNGRVFLGIVTEDDMRDDIQSFLDKAMREHEMILGYIHGEQYGLCAR